MKAIILAAGRGSRLGEIARTIPKALVPVCGIPIIDHTLRSLPNSVSAVFIVVNHFAGKIREHIESNKTGHEIRFVEQSDLTGTAGALWQVRPFLNNEMFLVLNGDDLYNKEDLELLLKKDLAIGLTRGTPFNNKYLIIDTDPAGRISGWHKPDEKEMNSKVPLVNGSYILNCGIFKYDPVKMHNGELGLPHTILKMAESVPVFGHFMDFWYPINSVDDLKNCESKLDRK